MSATATRDPRFDAELRHRALAAYRRTGSYRKAAREIGKSAKRTHGLVKEALKMEMEEARS